MAKYVKCPRCELNYIDVEKQQYCDVCQKEMKGVTDDEPLFSEEEEMELCPICGENMMRLGEKMCEECLQKSEYEEPDPDVDLNNDEEWRDYLDDEPEEIEDIGISPEDLDDEEEDDEEGLDEEEQPEEDFEYVTGDDIYKYSEGFDDEDDEDDEDEDDLDEIVPVKKRGRKKNDDF